VAEVRALGARKSPLRRRSRAPNAVSLAVAVTIALLLPRPSQAQTPAPAPAPAFGNVASAGNAASTGSTASSGNAASSGNDLFQPSLGGNPATPPRFRRPGAATPLAVDQPPPPDKFVAPTRIGATPIYGSPNRLGAGDTGYDSSNTPRSKKKEAAARTGGRRAGSAGTGNDFHAGADIQSRRAEPAPGADKSAATHDLSKERGDSARRKFAAVGY